MTAPGKVESDRVKAQALHKVLMGGDQLTVVRARAAQMSRDNTYDPAGRLEGFIPICMDWHAKVCLLEVGLLVFMSYGVHIFAHCIYTNRLFGSDCLKAVQVEIQGHWAN